MRIKPETGDIEDRECMSEIAESMEDLSTTTEALSFAEQMVSLDARLKRIERSSTTMPDIDANARDPTYFIAAYFDTTNFTEAFWIYGTVKSLTRYILFSDKFHETGEEGYALFAEDILQGLMKSLRSGHYSILVFSVEYWLKQFSAFWNFEKRVKQKVLENHKFSYTEIRHYNLAKASDAPLVYARVLDTKLPSFNENVSLILHYNQALLDILDDWEDIEEDARQDMPNIFIMAASASIAYDKIRKCELDSTRDMVLSETNSIEPIDRLVRDYQAAINNVSLPKNFSFLKFLSERYLEVLRSKMLQDAS
jgi:hypothetical protein